MSVDTEKRIHDEFREVVDTMCEGILPCIADKFKHTVRQAYYLGCRDGLAFAKEGEAEQVEGMRHNHEG